jgi:putative ribosome biogenesis GTPase RsgA
VREAVTAGSIATSRYEHYTAIRKTLVDRRKLFA